MSGFRSWYLGLLFCLAGCADGTSADHRTQFVAANRAFQNASTAQDYLTVAGTYQQLIDDGVKSVAVLNNQGNAFMQAEQPGRAIACYRQALRLTPGDPNINANLQIAIARVGGSDPPDDWFCQLFFWQNWIGHATKCQLATVLVGLASVLLIASRAANNRSLRTSGLVTSLAAAVAIVSVIYDWHRFEHQQAGVIIAETRAFAGTDTSYEPAFSDTLPEGVECTVTENRGDWLRIAIPDLGSGWVPRQSIVVY